MALITFQNLPNTTTPVNATNLNNNFTECFNIIASGSNANGSYLKFSDGTLIQRGLVEAPANQNYADITYPIEFYNTNYDLYGNQKYTGGSGYGGTAQCRCIATPQGYSTTAGYIYNMYGDETVPNFKRKMNWLAIGRWKA